MLFKISSKTRNERKSKDKEKFMNMPTLNILNSKKGLHLKK